MQSIKVNKNEKSTSIRISEKTKKMLETHSQGKETHEQIILRLLKLVDSMSISEGTELLEAKSAIGTKYKRINKTIEVETNSSKYAIVIVYNDFKIFAALRANKQLLNYIGKEFDLEWEVDLEIVNVRKDHGKWEKPTKENKLLYFVALKNILEETFDASIYEIATERDYLDLSKWEEIYKRLHLSMDSFDTDVKRKLP